MADDDRDRANLSTDRPTFANLTISPTAELAMPRPVMLAGLLGAAVGVPYAVEHSDEWRNQFSATLAPPAAQTASSIPGQPPLTPPEMPMPSSPGDHLYSSPAPLEGIATYSLAEVLRLDVTKEWVYHRWARKSTGLAEPELFGIRVPLVSGTRMTDVAGSLTYYFNVAGQVDKIRLTGKTADTTELVNLLVARYGFRPATPLVAGQQLMRVENNGRVESELKTWPDSVLWATSPHDSFSVELEINRPGSGRFVKPPALQLQAINTPPPPPPLLPGQSPPPPVGEPLLPAEGLVPSTDQVPSQQASTQTAASEASPVKKTPKPQLRWPN